MSLTVSMQKFRNTVNNIKNERDATMLKFSYLVAARNSEVLRKVSAKEMLNGATRNYGLFLRHQFQDYEVKAAKEDSPAVMEKVWLVTCACGKRGKRLKKNRDPEEELETVTKEEIVECLMKYNRKDLVQKWYHEGMKIDPLLIKVLLGKVHTKSIALPCTPKFEPWTLDCLKFFQKRAIKKGDANVTIGFDMERRQFWKIVRDNLGTILPAKGKHSIKNPLRHFRLSHLVSYYNFSPYDLTSYSGWTVRSTFGQMGVMASPNLDAYVHLRWRDYFGKLLKPLNQFTK